MIANNEAGEEEEVPEDKDSNLDEANLGDRDFADTDEDVDDVPDDTADDDLADDLADDVDDDADDYIDTDDEEVIPGEPIITDPLDQQPFATSEVSGPIYEPMILPKWKNMCLTENAKKRPIQLTEENAPKYAGIASNVGWKGRVDYALDYMEEDTEVNTNLLTCLLETVVSTVITFACGKTPPEDYIVCSALYLQYIRNEFGENPPNIAGFLEFIRQRCGDETMATLSAVRESSEDNLPPNVVITQLPKTLRQRFLE